MTGAAPGAVETTETAHTDNPRTIRKSSILAAIATVIALATTMTAATTAGAVTAVPPTEAAGTVTPELASLPNVTLKVGASDPSEILAHADTIAAVLKNRNISVGKNDLITPHPSAKVQDGMTITITRVKFVKTTKTKAIKKPKTKFVKDATIKKGVKKVVKKGRKGKAKVTVQKKLVNGTVVSTKKLKRTVIKKAKPKVVKVGTKNNNVNWDGVARCESGGNWHINTGNGYYGGLQFNYSTWLSNGGGKYAQYAHLATKQQQIDIANRLYASRGLQPWGCRAYG